MIRLGKRGYTSIMSNLTHTSDYLAACLEKLGFIIMSQRGGRGLPLVAFRLDPAKKHHYDEFTIAHHLRERGWVVPAYTMAPHSESLKLMRVVVREDFSRARCDSLLADIISALRACNKIDASKVEEQERYVFFLEFLLLLFCSSSCFLIIFFLKKIFPRKGRRKKKKKKAKQSKEVLHLCICFVYGLMKCKM